MKATELMIGDWVLTLDPTHEEKVQAQIWAIEEGQTSILVKKDITNWFVDIEWIEPIPLTPEILEKNGFRHGDGFEKRWYDVKIEDKEVTLYQSNTFYTLKIDEGIWPKLNNIYIHFVHKLQHALRLCGNDKTIEL